MININSYLKRAIKRNNKKTEKKACDITHNIPKKNTINILVLSSNYNSFVKEITEATSTISTVNICVLVRYNGLAELYKYLPIPSLSNHIKRYTKKNIVSISNLPQNICVHLINLKYLIPDGYNVSLPVHLYKKIRDFIYKNNINIDIIHSHFSWPYGVVGIYLKRHFNVPLVVSLHGSDVREPLLNRSNHNWRLLNFALYKVIQYSDALVTYHEEIRDLLIRRYGPEIKKKLIFTYKPIPESRFNCSHTNIYKNEQRCNSPILDSGKYKVLFLARVDKDKDPITFIKAAKLLRKYKDIIFILVGTGKLFDHVKEFKQKNKLSNVYLVGWSSTPERWFCTADVYCALSPIENIWSTTLQEAIMADLPIISTKVGYTTRVLTHLKNAYLIPPSNPVELARAILFLRNNPKYSKKIVAHNKKFKESFKEESFQKTMSILYSKLKGEFR